MNISDTAPATNGVSTRVPAREDALAVCLDQLKHLLAARLKRLKDGSEPAPATISPEAFGQVFLPHLPRDHFHVYEGLLLALALSPHVRPELIDRTLQEVFPDGGNFPELGGVRVNHYRGFLPTGFTALFLLAGDNLQQRLQIQSLLSPDHWLAREQVLKVVPVEQHAPPMAGTLQLDPELVEKLTVGRVSRPVFSADFPAMYVSTGLDWDDLVLTESTRQHIEDIQIWLTHHRTLRDDWQMGHRFKPGYRALFYGPPGTGKTLTATLLGKQTGMDVYKVDLSTVVSKYIGETEKNLASLFDRAENKNWILFFDEADALFGKRTQVQNAHDRYANQEVSYLLQRIENFDGLVILASNLKSNIDEAFLRRFQSMVHFPMPNQNERQLLWEKAIPGQLTLASDVNFKQIASKYELSGADIMNAVQYVCLQALARNKTLLCYEDLSKGIKQELLKANRLI